MAPARTSTVASLLLVALFAAGAPAAAAAATNVTQVTVFEAGQHGYACIRVPSVVRTPKGTLLAFAEARRTSCGDQSPKDVVMSRSMDGGHTWSDLRIVVGDGFNASTTFRNGYATVYTHGADTAIVLQCVNSSVSEPWVSLQTVSKDDGETWGAIQRVGGLEAYDGVLAGPGSGIQLGDHSPSSPHPGRVVSCGATGYHAGHSMEAVVWYADDGGLSGNYTVATTPPFANMQECQVVELADGSLMINMRNSHLNSSCDCRGVATSADGGETWSPVHYDPALVEPVCSAGLVNINGDLYFSNPATKSKRDHMTVKKSTESGAVGSWDAGLLLWEGPAAYSVEVGMDTHVGVMYERGVKQPYEEIVFAIVPVGDARV